jgi:hypothetical protein
MSMTGITTFISVPNRDLFNFLEVDDHAVFCSLIDMLTNK